MNKRLKWMGMSAALFLAPALSMASHTNQHARVDGMDIYYGIVPSEIVQAHPKEHPEAVMHGGPRSGSYHLVASVLNHQTGKPITDAQVTARVSSGLGRGRQEKPLEPMRINNTVSYGNYFAFTRPGTYHIDITVARPGEPGSRHAEFSYPVH